MKANEGEVPQYYVEDTHPAIISPAEWELVQNELARRQSIRKYTSDIFSGLIICGDCGSIYGPKVWHSNDKYRKVIYQCNNKFKGDKCSTPNLTEARLKELFIDVYSEFYESREQTISDMQFLLDACFDTDKIAAKQTRLESEISGIDSQLYELIQQNASAAIDEDSYREQYDSLQAKRAKLQQRYETLAEQITETERERMVLQEAIRRLSEEDAIPMEFDAMLFRSTVCNVVMRDDRIAEFRMIGGKVYEREV